MYLNILSNSTSRYTVFPIGINPLGSPSFNEFRRVPKPPNKIIKPSDGKPYLEVVSKTFRPNDLHYLDPSVWTKITEHVYNSGSMSKKDKKKFGKHSEKHLDKIRKKHHDKIRESMRHNNIPDTNYIDSIDNAIQNAIDAEKERFTQDTNRNYRKTGKN